MKKLPDKLAEIQEQRRMTTSKTVTDAIISLQAQGYDIKIKDLIFVTGLSRSVFAKPHVRRILIKYGVVEPRKSAIGDVYGRNDKASKHKALLSEKDSYIARLLIENERLKQECEILRGKIFLLMHKNSIIDDKLE